MKNSKQLVEQFEFIRRLGLAEWKEENTEELKADHRETLEDLQSGNEGGVLNILNQNMIERGRKTVCLSVTCL